MSHLDDLTAALVDNELSHDARDRALSHITGCDGCRAEVDAQRRLKAMLANQADPELPRGLEARLLDIARTAAGPTTPDVVRGASTRPGPPRRRVARRPAPRGSLRSRAATYSALGVALVAGVAAVGGDPSAPRVRPPVETFVEDHAATTGRLGPLHDPAGSVVLSSFGR
jgi:anti-sigma factor RsiW